MWSCWRGLRRTPRPLVSSYVIAGVGTLYRRWRVCFRRLAAVPLHSGRFASLPRRLPTEAAAHQPVTVCVRAGGFDMIVDDGSHIPDQQIISLEHLWKAVRPGGVYVIEVRVRVCACVFLGARTLSGARRCWHGWRAGVACNHPAPMRHPHLTPLQHFTPRRTLPCPWLAGVWMSVATCSQCWLAGRRVAVHARCRREPLPLAPTAPMFTHRTHCGRTCTTTGATRVTGRGANRPHSSSRCTSASSTL